MRPQSLDGWAPYASASHSLLNHTFNRYLLSPYYIAPPIYVSPHSNITWIPSIQARTGTLSAMKDSLQWRLMGWGLTINDSCLVICLHALKGLSKTRAWESAFLLCSHMMSVLLVWGPHWEGPWVRDSVVSREIRNWDLDYGWLRSLQVKRQEERLSIGLEATGRCHFGKQS